MAIQWGQAIAAPSNPWLDRLRVGDQVYLCRAGVWATVADTWVPAADGGRVGILSVALYRITDDHGHVPVSVEDWQVDAHGRGLDVDDQILVPVEGNFSRAPVSCDASRFRRLEAQIAKLTSRVAVDEKAMNVLIAAMLKRGSCPEEQDALVELENALDQFCSNWANRL